MSFGPLETERLTIRRPEIGDADALFERRNHPDVARYQSWSTPYAMESARKVTAGAATMHGPTEDEWWMVTIVERSTGRIIGDLAIHQSFQGRAVEIGYSLLPDSWGQGYATEAASAVVDTLIAGGVRRLSASTHPDNLASVRVLEHLGFDYEGRTVESFFEGDGQDAEISDGLFFGLSADRRARWLARPTHRPQRVNLIEIDNDSFSAVAELRTHYSQRHLVSPVSESFGDALFAPLVDGLPITPWLRAIEVSDDDGNGNASAPTLAGFVMMAMPMDGEPPGGREPYLWRLLIDRWHQRRGIASLALDEIEATLGASGHTTMTVHWEPGPGSPEPFYLARGYQPTGEVHDGEIEGRKRLI